MFLVASRSCLKEFFFLIGNVKLQDHKLYHFSLYLFSILIVLMTYEYAFSFVAKIFLVVTGVEDKSFCQAANIDNDVSNLCSSPSLWSQNHQGGFAFSFEKLDTNPVIHLGSSLIDLLQSDDPNRVIFFGLLQ